MEDDREIGTKLEVNPPNSSRPPEPPRETVRPREEPKPGAETRAETGADDGGAPRQSSSPAGQHSSQPTVLAALYIASPFIGLTGLVAFILALIWRGEAREAWEVSHYDYQIRTFVIWLALSIVSVILIFTIIGAIIGIPLLIAAMIQVLVRGILSLIRALNAEPMPNPNSLLV